MRLTVLGVGAVRPNPRGATAGYLLESGGHAYLVDCGFGVLAQLLAVMPPAKLEGIFISHTHPDHCSDLVAVRMALVHAPGPRLSNPIPVYALEESIADLERLGRVYAEDFWVDVLSFVPVSADTVLRAQGLEVEFAPTLHFRSCLAMRFTGDGRSIAYTADSGPSDAVAQLAQGSDLLLSEATLDERREEEDQWGHMTASEAGELAAGCGVGQLVLTHYFAEYGLERLRRAAADAFGGPVVIAREGDVYEL